MRKSCIFIILITISIIPVINISLISIATEVSIKTIITGIMDQTIVVLLSQMEFISNALSTMLFFTQNMWQSSRMKMMIIIIALILTISIVYSYYYQYYNYFLITIRVITVILLLSLK